MTDRQAFLHCVQAYRDGQTTLEQFVAGTGAAVPDIGEWWRLIRAHIPREEWREMERHAAGNIHRDRVLLIRQKVTAAYIRQHGCYGMA